mmetsp:Transcript_41373/g.97275  ORF Transcript_41373/g.97275 Transcript_41373/m.97275 type:complete len:501 (+) Transcript_41373:449-1951(+)
MSLPSERSVKMPATGQPIGDVHVSHSTSATCSALSTRSPPLRTSHHPSSAVQLDCNSAPSALQSSERTAAACAPRSRSGSGAPSARGARTMIWPSACPMASSAQSGLNASAVTSPAPGLPILASSLSDSGSSSSALPSARPTASDEPLAAHVRECAGARKERTHVPRCWFASQIRTVQSSPAEAKRCALRGCAASPHSSERGPPSPQLEAGIRAAQWLCSSSRQCGLPPPSCNIAPERVTTQRVPRANTSARTHGASAASRQRPYASVSPAESWPKSTGLAALASSGEPSAGQSSSRPPRPPTAMPSVEAAMANSGKACSRTDRTTCASAPHSSSSPLDVPVTSTPLDGSHAAHSTVCAPVGPKCPLRATHPPLPPLPGRAQKRTCRCPYDTIDESTGEKVSPSTVPAPPRVSESSVPARQFHSATVLARDRSALASSAPSGLNASAPTPSRCPPAKRASRAKERVDQTCTGARCEASADATSSPPGCSALQRTSAPCPV